MFKLFLIPYVGNEMIQSHSLKTSTSKVRVLEVGGTNASKCTIDAPRRGEEEERHDTRRQQRRRAVHLLFPVATIRLTPGKPRSWESILIASTHSRRNNQIQLVYPTSTPEDGGSKLFSEILRRALYQRQLQSDGTDGTSHSARHDDYLHYDSLDNVAISSFISGGATSIFTSPMVIVKTKQQIMVWGFRKAIEDTFRHGRNTQQQRPQLLKGLRNFYTGFGVHFYCDAVGTAVYFTSYEYFKRKFAERNSDEEDVSNSQVSARNISLGERMLCAAGAGMVCWGVIFPADVIRSRLYAQSITNESSMAPLTGFQLARQMVQEQGFRSLYRGVGITVARAGPVAAAVLPVYDYVLAWLSSD
eukprot:scaffold559_cov190-Alexandrium_tamarense.AAC.21